MIPPEALSEGPWQDSGCVVGVQCWPVEQGVQTELDSTLCRSMFPNFSDRDSQPSSVDELPPLGQ